MLTVIASGLMPTQQVGLAQPPAPPAAPDAPSNGQPDASPDAAAQAPTGVQLPGSEAVVPLTRQQVQAIDRRGTELSNQMRSVQARRDDVARELNNTTQPADRAGLEERLKFLDQRILTLEQAIDANSSARAALEANYVATSGSSDGDNSGNNGDQYDGLIAFAVLFPISLAIARAIWRRTSRRSVQAAIPQAEARFAQLEQSIDTVAVEIERVAEGQRYVTRLLREGQPIPDFVSGQAAEPVRSRLEDAR